MTGAAHRDAADAARLPRPPALHRPRRRAGGAEGMTHDAERPQARRHERLPRSGLQGDRAARRCSTAPRRITSTASARIDRAHLVMLAETGILDARDRRRRSPRALDAIDARDRPRRRSTYTGEVEDFFFLIEAELQARLGPDVAGRLHTGRSRNDIDHTLFKLGAEASGIDALRGAGCARLLGDADRRGASASAATLIVAYTHGQPAQPTTFGHYLARRDRGAAARHRAAVAGAREIVDLSPMGAAAITTSGFPIDRAARGASFSASRRRCATPTAASRRSTTSPRPIRRIELMFLHLGRLDPGPAVLDEPSRSGRSTCRTPSCRSPRSCRRSATRCRSSTCATWRRQTVGRARHGADVDPQHALHRHERQRGRDAGDGLRGLRVRRRACSICSPRFVAAIRIDDGARAPTTSAAPASPSPNWPTRSCASRACRSARRTRSRPPSPRAVVATGGGLGKDGYAPFLDAFAAGDGPRAVASAATTFAEIVSPEHFVAVRDRFGGPAPAALARRFAIYGGKAAAFEAAARRAMPRARPRAGQRTRRSASRRWWRRADGDDRPRATWSSATARPRSSTASTSTSPTASSSCWSARRAAASRRRCA